MSNELNKRVGNYELILRVGAGGQASVYRARCVVGDRPRVAKGQHVALKVLRTNEQGRRSERRFRRQVEAFLALDHPNIVRYLDWFTIRDEMGDELRCLVMEFLEGEELKDFMAKYPAGMSWPQLKRVFTQCMRALAYAAGIGLVHRDVKPSNIFLMRDGTAKVIDFGIAKRQDATVTTTAGFKGTFDYMAPDFLKEGSGFRGDVRSDIFSLGVCFAEALTGALPYPSVSDTGSMGYLNRWHKDGFKGPDVTTKHLRVLNEWAAAFVVRCMAEDREQRYQSFEEMLVDFEKIEPVRIRDGNECYTFTEYLGKGNLAEVFRAQRERDGKVFAVKHLLPAEEPLCFRREGRELEKFPHTNMVAYEGRMRAVTPEGEGDEYLILQFLENVPLWSLRARIDKNGPLDPREALHHFVLYLRALEYLHEGRMQPIVHGDISPLTLYCPPWDPGHPSEKNNGKLLDLGVEYRNKRESGFLKPTNREYMSPEFVLDPEFGGSPQSDIYAIGLCLYEALCGERVYPLLPEGEEAMRRGMRARAEGAVAVSFGSGIFRSLPELARIVRHALARDPDDRYPSARAMRTDLESVTAAIPEDGYETMASYDVVPEETFASVPDAAPTVMPSDETDLPELPSPGRRRHSRFGVLLGSVVAVVVLGVAVWIGVKGSGCDRNDLPKGVPPFEATAVYVASFVGSVEVAERRCKEVPDDRNAARVTEELHEAWSKLPRRFDAAFASACNAGRIEDARRIAGEWSACTESLPFRDLDLAAHRRRKESMQRRLGYAEMREACIRPSLSVDYAGRLEKCLTLLEVGMKEAVLPEAKAWWLAQSEELGGSIAGVAALASNMITRHLVQKEDVATAEKVAVIWHDIATKTGLVAAMPNERVVEVTEAMRRGLHGRLDAERAEAVAAAQAGGASATQRYAQAVQRLSRDAPMLFRLAVPDAATQARITEFTAQAERTLASGDLEAADAALAELERIGGVPAAATLRARHESLAGERETNRRHAKASVAYEKARTLDRGQGFGAQLDAFEVAWHEAEAARQGGNWSQALSAYDKTLAESAALVELDKARQSAAAERTKAVAAEEEAASAGAEADAPAEWTAADRASSRAEDAFGNGDSTTAASSWREAAAAFAQAKTRALAVQEYRVQKSAYLTELKTADEALLRQFGGSAWLEVEKNAGLGAGSANDPAKGSRAYAAALKALPEAVRAAGEARQAARIEAALNGARQARTAGTWGKVVEHCDAALSFDPGNREAQALKREAEENLKPTWKLVATLNGREVPATIAIGTQTWTAPQSLPLKEGGTYKASFSYESGGKRYVADDVTLTVDWMGMREQRVALREVPAGPSPGRGWTSPSTGMEFVWVEKAGVWFGKYEVTNAEYRKFKRDHDSGEYKKESLNGDRQPAANVTWEDAKAFCNWLTEEDRRRGQLGSGWEYRLPSDREWSVAVGLEEPRVGSPKVKSGKIEDVYPWGNEWPPPRGAGNYGGSESALPFKLRGYRDEHAVTAPVGSFKANAQGLHDLGGNVWEWCEDWYDPGQQVRRVLRGGCWNYNSARDLLSSSRSSFTPGFRNFNLGFRVVLCHESVRQAG